MDENINITQYFDIDELCIINNVLLTEKEQLEEKTEGVVVKKLSSHEEYEYDNNKAHLKEIMRILKKLDILIPCEED